MATTMGIEARHAALFRTLTIRTLAAAVVTFVTMTAQGQAIGEFPGIATQFFAENEFIFGVQSSIGATDNVRRSPTDEVSDVIASIGLVGQWSKSDGRLRGTAGWDISYYSYLDDTYDDQVFGGVNLFAEYDIAQDWLTWVAQWNFGQADVNPFESSNPGNVQNVSYFTTGPDLKMRFGPRTSVVVGGRYSNVTYETTRGDNERLQGTVSLRHEISERTTLSLNGSAERIEYKYVPPGSDFDRQEAYAAVTLQGQRTTLGLEGGMTWLHDRGETFDGPLYRITLNRQVGGYSSLRLSAGKEFSDAGDVFRYGNTIGGGGFEETEGIFDNPDPFERDFVTVGWTTDRERTQFTAYLNWSDESYETLTQLDRTLSGARLELTHALTPRTYLIGGLGYTHQDYESGFDEDEWRFDVTYGWQVAQPLFVDFTYRRWDRDVSTFAGSAVENLFFVSLTYNFAQ
jgi:hypothetical protein